MPSSNLPPGVTDNMIPGNRQEDIAAEALYEAIDDKCREFNCAYPDDRLIDWIIDQILSRH